MENESVRRAIGLGCAGGIGMAALMIMIGGAVYLSLSASGLSRTMILFLSFAGGPILGNAILLTVVYLRSRRGAE